MRTYNMRQYCCFMSCCLMVLRARSAKLEFKNVETFLKVLGPCHLVIPPRYPILGCNLAM